jgi:hypothetical protein
VQLASFRLSVAFAAVTVSQGHILVIVAESRWFLVIAAAATTEVKSSLYSLPDG